MLGDSPAQFSILLHGDRHGSLERTGFIEDITSRRRLILFDGRGIGLSQRGLDDYSTDARLRDLAAVVDACELDDVDLMGNLFSGPIAVEVESTFCPKRPMAPQRALCANLLTTALASVTI